MLLLCSCLDQGCDQSALYIEQETWERFAPGIKAVLSILGGRLLITNTNFLQKCSNEGILDFIIKRPFENVNALLV